LKKITIFLINFIFEIDLNFNTDEKELKNIMELVTFPEFIENLNTNFIEMIKKRGELIIVNCGHNGTLNRSAKESLRIFLSKTLNQNITIN